MLDSTCDLRQETQVELRALSAAAERDGEHGAALGRYVLDALAAREGPHPDRAVVRAADEELPLHGHPAHAG